MNIAKPTLLSIQQEKTVQEQIFAERVKILYRQLFLSIPVGFACASIVFYSLQDTDNLALLWGWYMSVIVISLMRFLYLWQYKRSPQQNTKHLRYFVMGAVLAAATWGIAGSLLMPENDFAGQALIIIIIAGISAGGLQAFMGSATAGVSFIFISLAPLAIWLLSRADEEHLLLGITMTFYLLFMIMTAVRGYKTLSETLHLRYENLALVKDLKDSNKNLQEAIKAHEKAEDKINYLATHDNLTHLLNRNSLEISFAQLLAQAKRESQKFATLFLDLDHFKTINDSLGHALGDQLLTKTAERLTEALRKNDIIARIGGDEFVIILPNMHDQKNIIEVLKKIFQQFITPFSLDGQAITITPSIGISLYPEDGDNRQILLKKADSALYRAKEEGRNCYRFHQENNASSHSNNSHI